MTALRRLETDGRPPSWGELAPVGGEHDMAVQIEVGSFKPAPRTQVDYADRHRIRLCRPSYSNASSTGAVMHRIGFVLFDGFQIMSSAAIGVFEMANLITKEPFYDLSVLSKGGGPLRSAFGMLVETRTVQGAFDTLIVAGGIAVEPTPPAVLAVLRSVAVKSRRVAAICTGAFVLGEAGLLDGRRATTHWLYRRELQARFPAVKVTEDRIFIEDGPIWTSAGMTAGIDLALAMVEKDLGAELAYRVAKSLVLSHRRGGCESQFSALLELDPKSDRIQLALSHARQNLRNRLSVAELAAVAHLSARQFSRVFREETGQSPARAIESLRVEAARSILAKGAYSVEEVAEETGFADRERMRRAFLRAFGKPPQKMRHISRDDRRSAARLAVRPRKPVEV